MTPQVGTAIGETLADLVLRAEKAEARADQLAAEDERLKGELWALRYAPEELIIRLAALQREPGD